MFKTEQSALKFFCQSNSKIDVSCFCIYSAIRQGFLSPKVPQIFKSAECNIGYLASFPFQNNLVNLDPSFKMDLDFWNCCGRDKPQFYTPVNMIHDPSLHS